MVIVDEITLGTQFFAQYTFYSCYEIMLGSHLCQEFSKCVPWSL